MCRYVQVLCTRYAKYTSWYDCRCAEEVGSGRSITEDHRRIKAERERKGKTKRKRKKEKKKKREKDSGNKKNRDECNEES